MKILILTLALLITSGCAIAPLSTNTTARSYGENSFYISGGISSFGIPDGRLGYGFTDNWDGWVTYDFISLGISTRYSFINNQERGWSVAGIAGVGTSFGGSYYYLAPVVSYKLEKFEPYLVARYNHSDVDEDAYEDFLENLFKTTNADVGSLDFTYGQVALGTRFWVNSNFFFGLEANIFIALDDKIDFTEDVSASIFIGGINSVTK